MIEMLRRSAEHVMINMVIAIFERSVCHVNRHDVMDAWLTDCDTT